ncbi:MAG TPA: DUF3108 domain-containing protein [Gemmatimonadaceae bacterium]|jgi:hypothetical protein
MQRHSRRAAPILVCALLALVPSVLRAQVVAQAGAPSLAAASLSVAPVPFASGERLEYDVKFGFLHVGRGSMQVAGIDTVRGHATWHTVFHVQGGTLFFKVNDRLESWIDVSNLVSLRHWQELSEGRRSRERRFEIMPDRGIVLEEGKPETATVAAPLDDGAFLYFVRTIPLEVGKTYEFDRYFRPDRNPVTIRVLRREHIRVPAGEFDAIVLQPIIKTNGIFSEGGRAEIWLSDDANRIMLQMKSKLPFGSLNLYLTSYQRGVAPAVSSERSAPDSLP